MAKQIAWSWTRLETFEQCPRKFQGSYITKDFPQPDFDAPHFLKGRAVHEVLEHYIADGTPITTPILHKDKKGQVHEFKVDLLFLMPLLDKLRSAQGTEVELQVCYDQELNEISWFDKRAWCRVIFDLIVVVGDFCLILDWKTGKVKQYSDQLKLFAGAAFTKYPNVNRVLSAYVWCEHPTQKPVWAEYTRAKDAYSIWEEFGDRAELIQMANESGNWPAKKNMFCKWCDALPSQCEFKR
jgi:hypothetical protein